MSVVITGGLSIYAANKAANTAIKVAINEAHSNYKSNYTNSIVNYKVSQLKELDENLSDYTTLVSNEQLILIILMRIIQKI